MPLKKQMFVVEGYGYVPADEGARPEHPIYIPVDPPPDSGLSPEHPIYIPVYPDNSLPGDQPRPDNTLPGDQPRPDQGLPGDQPRPDQGLPGAQPAPEHPIYIPVPVPPDSGLSPEHPIYIPVYPDNSLPPSGGGGGGGGDLIPSHPIQLPPPDLTDEQKEKLLGFLIGNLPNFGAGIPQPTPVQRR